MNKYRPVMASILLLVLTLVAFWTGNHTDGAIFLTGALILFGRWP